jgi:hypothetical protein
MPEGQPTSHATVRQTFLSAKGNSLHWNGNSQEEGWPILDLDISPSVAHHNHRPRRPLSLRENVAFRSAKVALWPQRPTRQPSFSFFDLLLLFFRFSYTPRTVLRRNNFRRQPVCPEPIHPNSKGLEQ